MRRRKVTRLLLLPTRTRFPESLSMLSPVDQRLMHTEEMDTLVAVVVALTSEEDEDNSKTAAVEVEERLEVEVPVNLPRHEFV
jgi:hypothetical protein